MKIGIFSLGFLFFANSNAFAIPVLLLSQRGTEHRFDTHELLVALNRGNNSTARDIVCGSLPGDVEIEVLDGRADLISVSTSELKTKIEEHGLSASDICG